MAVGDCRVIAIFLIFTVSVNVQCNSYGSVSYGSISFTACNVTALNACIQSFNSTNIQFQTAQINASTISAACSQYNSTVYCVSNGAKCPDTDANVIYSWLGDKQGIGYRCGDGMLAYLQNQPCLGNGTFIPAFLEQCSNPQIQSPASNTSNPTVVCQDYYNQQNCTQTLAQRICGAGAAQFLKTVLSKLLGPAVQARNQTCNVSRSAPGAMWLTNVYLILTALLVGIKFGKLSSSQ